MIFDTTDLLVDLVIAGGAYYIGNKNGQNKVIKQIEDRQRDEEIRKLKEEIQKLRGQ